MSASSILPSLPLDKKRQRAERLITCPICFGFYKKPKTLPTCGHTFCYECLCQVAAVSKDDDFYNNNSNNSKPSKFVIIKVACPDCRRECAIFRHHDDNPAGFSWDMPSLKFDDLPTNFQLEKIVALLSILGDDTTPPDDTKLCKAADAILGAAEIDRMDIAELLLDAFCPEILERRLMKFYGCTLLCLACSAAGLYNLATHLVLERGANVRASCGALLLGPMPIHFAATFGRLDVMAFLCQRFPDQIYARDHADRTPLCVAAENGCLDVVRFLIEQHDADPWTRNSVNGKDCSIALNLAVETGKLDVVKYLIDRCPDMIDFVDGEGETLLTRAALSPVVETVNVIRYLVRIEGIDVDRRNLTGMTPLHMSVIYGDSSAIVAALLECGADLNAAIDDRCDDADLQGRTIFDVDIQNDDIRAYVAQLKKANRSRQKE